MIDLGEFGLLDKEQPDIAERFRKQIQVIEESCPPEIFEGFVKLVKSLKKTTFFDDPASHKYHLARPHGLVEHTCNVMESAQKIRQALAPEIPAWKVGIAACCHDLGKAYPGYGRYILREPTPRQKQYGFKPDPPYSFERDKSLPYFDHEDMSVIMLLRYIPRIPNDVVQAVLTHNGPYVGHNENYKMKQTDLALIIHWGDCWSGAIIEERVNL